MKSCFIAIAVGAFFTLNGAIATEPQPQSHLQSQEPAKESQEIPGNTLFKPFIKYAEFAAAAYAGVDDMKHTSASYEYAFSDSGANLSDKVRYFIATNPVTKSQIIAVRGTANVENAGVDIDYELTEDGLLGIGLHKGFAQSSLNIYKMVKKKLNKDYTIDVTGHSLGGAVAVILAMYLDSDGYKINQVITFGQPRITDRAGAKKFQHLNVIRVSNLDDVIPTLPPFDASQILNLKVDVFWPLGKEYVLLSDKYYSELEGTASLLRGINFLNKKPSEENITAHRIDTYLQRLNRLQNRGIEIPFAEREKYLKPGNEPSV